MKRLFIFGTTELYGGIEALIFDILKHTNICEHFDQIIIANETLVDFYNGISEKITIVKCPNKKSFLEYKSFLNELFNDATKNDVVYANITSYCNYALFNKMAKLPCKKIIHGHQAKAYHFINSVLHTIGKHIFKNIGYKVAVSECCNKFMFSNKADVVLYNGIESEKFYFSSQYRSSNREFLKISNEKNVVGCIGRICKEKNQIDIVRFAKNYPNILFIFAGSFASSKYKNKIVSIAPSNCIFIGQKNNIYELLSSFDAVIIGSKSEAFSLSMCESLTNGLPVFIYNKLYKNLSFIFSNNRLVHVIEKSNQFENLLLQSNVERNDSSYKYINNTYSNTKFLITIEKILITD